MTAMKICFYFCTEKRKGIKLNTMCNVARISRKSAKKRSSKKFGECMHNSNPLQRHEHVLSVLILH